MEEQNHVPTKSSNRKSYLNSLHKPLQKPMTKHFIAPLPPTRPKVYDVDALNFKKVVHALTSTPEFLYSTSNTHRCHLKDIAPPPLVLSTLPKQSLFPTTPHPPIVPLVEFSTEEKSNHDPLPDFYNYLKNDSLLESDTTFGLKSSVVHDNEMDYLGSSVGFSYDDPYSHPMMSPLRFSMSPNSLSWCYSGLLSPGTLSSVL